MNLSRFFPWRRRTPKPPPPYPSSPVAELTMQELMTEIKRRCKACEIVAVRDLGGQTTIEMGFKGSAITLGQVHPLLANWIANTLSEECGDDLTREIEA